MFGVEPVNGQAFQRFEFKYRTLEQTAIIAPDPNVACFCVMITQ